MPRSRHNTVVMLWLPNFISWNFPFKESSFIWVFIVLLVISPTKVHKQMREQMSFVLNSLEKYLAEKTEFTWKSQNLKA